MLERLASRGEFAARGAGAWRVAGARAAGNVWGTYLGSGCGSGHSHRHTAKGSFRDIVVDYIIQLELFNVGS